MKNLPQSPVFALLALTFIAFDAQSASQELQQQTATTVTNLVKKLASDTSTPKWKVDYTGDLSGSIQGQIMTNLGRSIMGMAIKPDKTGTAPQDISIMLFDKLNTDQPIKAQMDITLADGTRCIDVRTSADAVSSMIVLDKSRRALRATMSGELYCGTGKDKRITYTAELNETP